MGPEKTKQWTESGHEGNLNQYERHFPQTSSGVIYHWWKKWLQQLQRGTFQTEQLHHADVWKGQKCFWGTRAPCAACTDNSIILRVCFDLFAQDRLCLRSLASQRCSVLPLRSSTVQGCVSFSCLWCKFYSSLTLIFLPPILPSPPAAKWRQRSCFSPPLVWWLSKRRPINLNSLQTLKNVLFSWLPGWR